MDRFKAFLEIAVTYKIIEAVKAAYRRIDRTVKVELSYILIEKKRMYPLVCRIYHGLGQHIVGNIASDKIVSEP